MIELGKQKVQQYADSLSGLARSQKKPIEGFIITGLKIYAIPEGIWRQPEFCGLMEVDISYNRLTSLPSSIGCLARLTYLNISHNILNRLPKELYRNCTQLVDLDVRQR